MKKITLIIIIISIAFSSLQSRKLYVGPNSELKTPSQAAAIAKNKDTILIEKGEYKGDVCYWAPDSITIIGQKGFAHLEADGKSYGQKAIWVIGGNDYTLENIEFSGCKVPDHNGAGIRQEGRNLTVRHCYFHHNEMGILTGIDTTSYINIEFSEFAYSGYGDGYSHNVYIGKVGMLRFIGNYSHHSLVGHTLKSRAQRNIIQYNFFSDGEDGNSSMHVDLPNGGFSVIMGNVFYQSKYSDNSRIITYGTEGLKYLAKNLYCLNNTFINKRETCTFLYMPSESFGIVANNFACGVGKYQIESTNVIDTTNIQFMTEEECGFTAPENWDFSINKKSPAIDAGTSFGFMSIFPMDPVSEYKHPQDTTARLIKNIIDCGAYEFIPETGINDIPYNADLIYPNPVKDKFYVKDNNISKVKIYDISGTEFPIQFKNNEIDVSFLNSGLYFIVYQSNNKIVKTMFIKI